MKTQAHLIVDGHNVIHAIPELAPLLADDRNVAREALLHLLRPIHDVEGTRLTVVFDGRAGRGSLQRQGSGDTFCIVYSSSEQTADGVIERMLLAARKPEAITVATNDRQIRNCAYEAGGAAVTAEELAKWSDRARTRQGQVARDTRGGPREEATPFTNRLDIPDIFPDQ